MADSVQVEEEPECDKCRRLAELSEANETGETSGSSFLAKNPLENVLSTDPVKRKAISLQVSRIEEKLKRHRGEIELESESNISDQ